MDRNPENIYPQILRLPIKMMGVCFTYALYRLLKEYKMELWHEFDLISSKGSYFLETYFQKTETPNPQDLIVYYDNQGCRKHFGIYIEEDLVESKWGCGAVYRHPIFYVNRNYGDRVEFYRSLETHFSSINSFRK